MLIVIETLFAVRFANQRENHYKIRCCDINSGNLQMKLFFYKQQIYWINKWILYISSVASFMKIGKVLEQLLQNECPYMITMVITYVGHRYDYKGQMW
jgi:hypothetical protein